MKRIYLIVATAFILFFAIGCAKDEVKPDERSAGRADTTREISGAQKNIPDIKSNSAKKEDEVKNNKETGTEKNAANENKNTNEETATNSSGSSSGSGSKKVKTDKNSKPSASSQTDEKKSEEKHDSNKESPKADQGETEKDNHNEKEPPPPPKKTVTVSIRTGDVKGTILSPTKVKISKGDTVLDASLKIAKKKGIQFSVRGSNANAYVEGIDNLYEFDEGQMSGWLTHLDGALIDRSAGAVTVKPDQTITWQYTTNYLEDSGRQD